MFEIIMLLAFAYAGFGRLLPAAGGKEQKKRNRSPASKGERSGKNGADTAKLAFCTHFFQPAGNLPPSRSGCRGGVEQRPGNLPARAA